MILSEPLAGAFASIALGHVGREYPNHLAHVFTGPEDTRTPRALHPVFYGSYDWHSCVHAHWMLAHLLRRFPAMPAAAPIAAHLDATLTPAAVAGECDYFARPAARGFSRPYGWAWLLKLAAALAHLPDRPWAAILAPLTEVIVERFADFLPKATYPIRTGTHFNTAFALRLAADYAAVQPEDTFAALLHDTATRWYDADAACQAWEPSGDDFLSPTLIEAECMRRLLPTERFLPWFDLFLPHLAAGSPATLLTPAAVSDRTDGKIAHLDGLNLSRAWCWRSLASALPAGDPRQGLMDRAAHAHRQAGLPHLAGDYMGEHWLASFAVLALDPG